LKLSNLRKGESIEVKIVGKYGKPDKPLFGKHSDLPRERLTKLAQWVDQNNIRVNVEKKFSLDEAGDALDYQKDVHPRGKVVLAM
jgi:NADPH:quinone reductase-like Zn-dependent oxidoreductase